MYFAYFVIGNDSNNYAHALIIRKTIYACTIGTNIMGLVSNNLVSSLCIGTTLFFVIFWVALSPVEADVTDDINWLEM